MATGARCEVQIAVNRTVEWVPGYVAASYPSPYESERGMRRYDVRTDDQRYIRGAHPMSVRHIVREEG
jgi:hypothetical protein